MSLTYFKHLVRGVSATQAVVLLHGTGGNEYDLLPLVRDVGQQFMIVSLRGNVLEHGMARFFRRLAVGVFDQESIRQEAEKLRLFMDAFSQQYHISIRQCTYLGYSNGANMLLALLFLYPEYVKNAFLLHPMVPFEPKKLDLKGKNIAISYGKEDQLVAAEESERVIAMLQDYGAKMHIFAHDGGHGITPAELEFVETTLALFSTQKPD